MAKVKVKKRSRRHGSFFMGLIDAFTAFVYSMFSNGRLGTWFSSGDKSYKNSIFSRLFDKVAKSYRSSALSDNVDLVMKKSKFAKATDAIRSFLSNLSLGVYGLFLLVYGVVSIFVYFIPIIIGGENLQGDSALITAIITTVCAIPLTASSGTLLTQVSESGVLKKVVLSFFAIPDERLKPGKKIVGPGFMMLAADLGIAMALLTYFWHPAYIFAIIGVVAVLCLISSNPEAGVVLTLAAVPFLQYTAAPEIILLALILVTVFSYVSKVIKRRRIITFSVEGLLAFIFCGFILMAGSFSVGGFRTFFDSVLAVAVILGAFVTTYNLIRGKRLFGSCVKIIAISFAILAILGVWNVFYDGIVDGVTYSIRDYVQPIFEGDNLYIVDDHSVFSVLVILSFPMMFCFMARQKKIKNFVGVLLVSLVMIGACFIYGTYETAVAIAIEFCIFWVIYSHKTFSVIIVALVPLGILLIMFPYIAKLFDVAEVVSAIGQYLPIPSPESSHYVGISNSTVMMLGDLKGGIGAGKHAFMTAIAPYLDASSRGAEAPGSFWLQVVCWSGIGGLITLLVFIGSVLKSSLGFLAVSRDKELRAEALAITCGLVGALIFGGVNCLWNDLRMLYLFWAMAGLLAGYVREGREISEKREAGFADELDNSDVELIFHK